MPPRVRKCILCGKEFEAPNGFVKRCSDQHYATCQVCGKQFPIDCEPNQIPKTCSESCRRVAIVKKRDKTVREKYGVQNVNDLDIVKTKISEANQTGGSGAKRRVTTCLHKYGVEHPSQTSEMRKRLSQVMNSDAYKKKVKQTSMDRYGVDNYWKQEDALERRRLHSIEKYGRPGKPWSLHQYLDVMTDKTKLDEYLNFKSSPERWIAEHYPDCKPNIRDLRSDLGVTDTPIYDILIAHNCSHLVNTPTSSMMEDEVLELIKTLRPDLNVITNDRTVIAPLELDLYIPELNLAIECNPTCTHNSSFCDPWGSPPKSPSYHSTKSKMCKDRGVFLFHIFGYEWTWRRDILTSMVKNLLNCSVEKIHGRKTSIREVPYTECSTFLTNNHRQGPTNASVRLGLYYEDVLVSLMTFGKVRNSLGDKSFEWELSRFCSKLETNVIGGASKLLNYFIQTYNPISIISFSDVSHTRGLVYEKLGFTCSNKLQSNYGWVDMHTDHWINRVNCQKRNLTKLFDDVTQDDIASKTERQIMESHGFARVFESGTLRWEWHR